MGAQTSTIVSLKFDVKDPYPSHDRSLDEVYFERDPSEDTLEEVECDNTDSKFQVPEIEIDNNVDVRGVAWPDLPKTVQDSRDAIRKKIKYFGDLLYEACNGDLSKLPDPLEQDHVQVKKSMDLIKSMRCAEIEAFCLDNGKLTEDERLEYSLEILIQFPYISKSFKTMSSLHSFYQTDLSGLQEKVVSNCTPNLQYFLNTRLVDFMNNPGAMSPTIFEGHNFNATDILRSMTSNERSNLITGLAKMSDLFKCPSEIFNQGVKFYNDAVNRALGLHCDLSIAEFHSQFSFCKSIKNYQYAYDVNETYWEKISNHTFKDAASSCQSKYLERDGYAFKVLITFGEYIVKKSEILCRIRRSEEAKELCLRTLRDLEEKTVQMRNGKEIKFSKTAAKTDLDMVIESIDTCLATINIHKFEFEEALEILSRNEVLEDGLGAVKNNHKALKQLMTETNYLSKENLEKDFEESKIIVNQDLKTHSIAGNGKIYVESLNKALRIAKNGDSIFLSIGEHNLEQTGKDGKMVTVLKKSVTIIGVSTNKTILNISKSMTMANVQFRGLHIKVGPSPIDVSQGRISFSSCLVEVHCCPCFKLGKLAEIDLSLCCFTSTGKFTALICLGNSDDSNIKINIRDCYFADFNFIIIINSQMNLKCGFDLHMESCSFLNIKSAMIRTYERSQKESVLAYPSSVAIRNCYVELWSSIEDSYPIIDINNASHVLIESTKFISKMGYPLVKEKTEMQTHRQVVTGLRFTNIQRVEITNSTIIRQGSDSTLASLRTYLEKAPMEDGGLDDAAIQLMAVHEATIRDSMLKGFYCGVTTKIRPELVSKMCITSEVSKFNKICFAGVYNCQFSNMAVCVLLDSRLTGRSIFVLSDISLQDSLVGVRVSEGCCGNGSVYVLDAKFINIASSIVVPKVLKQAACGLKDQKKTLLSRFEMKNLAFPHGGPHNVSRKKRRDDVIRNLMKAGILDSTLSIPYMEVIFKPKGDWLEIANEKDLEAFNFNTSDSQADCDNSVD